MEEYMQYNAKTLTPIAGAKAGMIRPMTMREKLVGRKEQLEAGLADVNAALAALDANPEIDKALDALSKVNHML